MASGFVKAELTTCRQRGHQVSCRLLYKSVLLLVFGLILWKWMNGVGSLDSNQECRIGNRHSHSRVSQCLASIRKRGNRRSSEGLRSFKPSKGTNLFILMPYNMQQQQQQPSQASSMPGFMNTSLSPVRSLQSN